MTKYLWDIEVLGDRMIIIRPSPKSRDFKFTEDAYLHKGVVYEYRNKMSNHKVFSLDTPFWTVFVEGRFLQRKVGEELGMLFVKVKKSESCYQNLALAKIRGLTTLKNKLKYYFSNEICWN